MNCQPFCLFSVIAILAGASQPAVADTLIYGGVEIRLPDTGYVIESGKMATLRNKEKKLIVEVYRFSKVPEASKEHIAEIMKPRQNTTDVVVVEAKEITQHGVTGMMAEGTAKIRGVDIRFLLVGIPVNDRAIVAVAYMRREDENVHRAEIEQILHSIKPRAPTRPKEPV